MDSQMQKSLVEIEIKSKHMNFTQEELFNILEDFRKEIYSTARHFSKHEAKNWLEAELRIINKQKYQGDIPVEHVVF